MRSSNKKNSNLFKRNHTNIVNSSEQHKRISNQSIGYDQSSHKGFCYYNRKVNTETNQIRCSDTKQHLTKKLYILPKGNLQKANQLNRKSYSRQIQQSKLLDGKSYDLANRFTFTQFNNNDLKNQSCFGFVPGGTLKKNSKKPHYAKPSYIKNNSGTNLYYNQNNINKKYKSPYDKLFKKGQDSNVNKPTQIKSIPKPKMQKRLVTQANDNHNNLSNQIYKPKEINNYTRNSSKNIFDTPQKSWDNQLEVLEQIGQGTFGKVYKAKNKQTGQIVAIKKVLQDKKYKSRQMQIIQMLKSDFTMKVMQSFITYQEKKGENQEFLNIVMDYYDCNLYQFIGRNRNLTNNLQLKVILYQMFRGLLYIHSLGICHRDIKPHNMLVKNGRLSLCDFGSAKILKKEQVNLSYICSRCYRAPQLIFGSVHYTTQIDIWAAGCIILQILNKVPLFIGQSSLDHLVQIIKVMGTPSKNQVMAMNPQYDLNEYDFPIIPKKQWYKLFPGVQAKLIDLINKIMRYSPKMRLTAAEILAHDYFDDIRDESRQNQIRLITKNKGFFDFTLQQIKLIENKNKVIPFWYSQKVQKAKRQSKQSKSNINVGVR